MVMRIRGGVLGDAEAICQVHKASVRGLCGDHYSAEQIEAWVGPTTPEDTRRGMAGGQRYLVARMTHTLRSGVPIPCVLMRKELR